MPGRRASCLSSNVSNSLEDGRFAHLPGALSLEDGRFVHLPMSPTPWKMGDLLIFQWPWAWNMGELLIFQHLQFLGRWAICSSSNVSWFLEDGRFAHLSMSPAPSHLPMALGLEDGRFAHLPMSSTLWKMCLPWKTGDLLIF